MTTLSLGRRPNRLSLKVAFAPGVLTHASTLLALAAALCAGGPALAQQRNPSGVPTPRLFQVSPAGGKAGTTVEVVLAGRNLADPTKLVFSHPGLKAEYVATPEPKPAAK